MRIADKILADFKNTGLLTFPEDSSMSVSGSCIGTSTGLRGQQVVRFGDESELLLTHEGGPVQMSLSMAYQLRVTAERRAIEAIQG